MISSLAFVKVKHHTDRLKNQSTYLLSLTIMAASHSSGSELWQEKFWVGVYFFRCRNAISQCPVVVYSCKNFMSSTLNVLEAVVGHHHNTPPKTHKKSTYIFRPHGEVRARVFSHRRNLLVPLDILCSKGTV